MSEVINAAVRSHLAEVHTSLPARVVSYDADKQSVDVQPLLKRGYRDETGTRKAEELPVIPNVPLVFPGLGPWHIVFPVVVGDTVLVVFCENSIDSWLHSGGQEVIDPKDDRRHTLNDAVAVPGLRTLRSAIAGPSDAMRVGCAGGAVIVIKENEIRLGSEGANVRVSLVDDLTFLKNAIQAAATAPADGGALFKANLLAALSAWPAGSQVVKAM